MRNFQLTQYAQKASQARPGPKETGTFQPKLKALFSFKKNFAKFFRFSAYIKY